VSSLLHEVEEDPALPKGRHFTLENGRDEGVRVYLAVRMVKSCAHLLPSVLKGHDILSPLPRIELLIAIGPDANQKLPPGRGECRHASLVFRRIDSDLAHPFGSSGGDPQARGRRRVRKKSGEPIVKDRNFEVFKRELGGNGSGPGGTEGAELGRRQEGALLPMRRIDNPLSPQGMPAQMRASLESSLSLPESREGVRGLAIEVHRPPVVLAVHAPLQSRLPRIGAIPDRNVDATVFIL
jgi:hypothetical protein